MTIDTSIETDELRVKLLGNLKQLNSQLARNINQYERAYALRPSNEFNAFQVIKLKESIERGLSENIKLIVATTTQLILLESL